MTNEELREKLAAALDQVHDKYVTEGGCNFQGWRSGHGSRPYVSDAVEELIALGVTLSEDDWEYMWGEPGESFEGFDTYETYEEARADFEEESDFESHRVMRRRKAGDWEAMS